MSTWRAGEQTTLNRALAAWFLVTLFLLPLYPKVGLVAISGTYIPVRADDLLIGSLGLIWAISLIAARRRPPLPTLVAGAAALWLAVTLVALVVGAFVLGSIGFLTGVAFWAKPLEYLLLAWIAYDLVRSQITSVRAVLAVVFASSAIVIGYGFFEHFRLVPRLPGQMAAPGVPTSTIGDVHELASYLGIVAVVLVAVWHRITSAMVRVAALIGLVLLLATIYYTGSRSEYVALGLCLLGLAFWRPARIPSSVGIAVMVLLFAVPLIGNLISPLLPSGGSNGGVEVPGDGTVTDRFFGEALGSSFDQRFNVKWRRYIEETMRSPIIGLGPSAATEAADGYYMRSFVESGIAGLISFVILVGAVFVSIWRVARRAVGLGRAVGVGMVAATVFVALVSVLIDTWVASRVMELYWPLLGTALAVGALQGVADEPVPSVVAGSPVTSTGGA